MSLSFGLARFATVDVSLSGLDARFDSEVLEAAGLRELPNREVMLSISDNKEWFPGDALE